MRDNLPTMLTIGVTERDLWQTDSPQLAWLVVHLLGIGCIGEAIEVISDRTRDEQGRPAPDSNSVIPTALLLIALAGRAPETYTLVLRECENRYLVRLAFRHSGNIVAALSAVEWMADEHLTLLVEVLRRSPRRLRAVYRLLSGRDNTGGRCLAALLERVTNELLGPHSRAESISAEASGDNPPRRAGGAAS